MALTAPPRPDELGGGSLREVATAADVAARQARERYQSSLEVLKASLAKLRLIKPELGAHEARLNELQGRVAGLGDEISDISRQARDKQKEIAAALAAATVVASKVTFSASAIAIARAGAEVSPPDNKPEASPEIERHDLASEVPKMQHTLSLKESSLLPTVTLQTAEASEPGRISKGGADLDSHASSGTSASRATVGGEHLQPHSLIKTSRPRVSFVSGDDGQSPCSEICHFDVPSFVGNEPTHGHWLPDEVRQRRPSFDDANKLAQRLSGRMVNFETDDGEACECVLVEPMGKILSPTEYVSTGVVVVVLGVGTQEETQEEWERVLSKTRWLDAGLSVALPDLEPGCGSERSRLEASVMECTRLVGVDKCLLIGKGWGAQLAVEVAAAGSVTRRLAGLLLVAPGELIEEACGQLDTAAFLLWARDDDVSEFSDLREWVQVMRQWKGPTYTKEVSSGGHDIAKMLEEKTAAQAFLHFASAALLVADLFRLASCIDEGDEVDTGSSPLPEGTVRLCDELPSYLIGILGGSSKDDEQEGGIANTLSQQAKCRQGSRNLRRAATRLQDWIACGMQQVASATE